MYVGVTFEPITDDKAGPNAGFDSYRPGFEFIHRVVLQPVVPVVLQRQLLLPGKSAPM